ncbi:MerC domain-containing protein [Maricurvus nonylphenolicus]|uniref:MerC domain-containing protein n=1 Tax=Maricurvus nonylphenolicus TaxID=1008307 RepID=UPI0036F2C75F
MKTIQAYSDKAAISLSLLCALHCLAVPLLVVYLPTLALPALTGEALHLWLLVVVIPVSAFAMFLGCKQHQRYRLGFFVGTGLSVLFISAIFGHDWFGEMGERVLTLVGSSIIAFGHFQNFKLCQIDKDCECSSNTKAAA